MRCKKESVKIREKNQEEYQTMKIIMNQTFDEERALYGSENISVKDCAFDGPADGESAFKECRNVETEHCFFNLRYPFWHDHDLKISGSEMTELCRAALWYSDHITIEDTFHDAVIGFTLPECSYERKVFLPVYREFCV